MIVLGSGNTQKKQLKQESLKSNFKDRFCKIFSNFCRGESCFYTSQRHSALWQN